MSLWQEQDWGDTPADNAITPEGEFTFELLKGSKYGKFNANQIEFGVKVAEGEFSGAVVYTRYPDPAEYDWVKGVFVRMLNAAIAQGFDGIEKGEDPVEYLNKVAGMKFKAKIAHRETTTSDGEAVTKADFKLGSIKNIVKQ